MNKRGIEFQRIFGIIIMCIVIICVSFRDNLSNLVDVQFFYNRVCQLRTCILDGVYPYFYYNDFMGVGYGSSFFYGQITLLPFIFFVNLSKDGFSSLLVINIFVLNFFGVAYFSKRYTSNHYMIATFYIISQCMLSSVLIGNLLAIGVSWFFLAKCVDFFRDNKSFIPASLLFFVLINSHLITSLLSFFCCCIICIYYFDKTKIKQYIKFAIFTSISCIYFLANMIYHLSCINIKTNVIGEYSKSYIIYLPNFLNYIIKSDSKSFENGIISALFIIPIIILLFRHKIKFSKRLVILSCFCFVICLFSLSKFWYDLSFITKYIQFPIRLYYFIIVFLLIVIFRYSDCKWIWFSILCLIDMLIVTMDFSNSLSYEPYHEYIANGEYVSVNFSWNEEVFDYMKSHVTNQNGYEIDYNVDKNKVIVNIPNHTEDWTITVPKLYYKGYYCDKGFNCYEGDNQFVSVDIGSFSGVLSIYYKQPFMLILVQCISDLTVVLLIIKYLRRVV